MTEPAESSSERPRVRPHLAPLGVAVLVAVLGAASLVAAQDVLEAPARSIEGRTSTPERPMSLAEALNRRGDLTLQGNSLNEALMAISDFWKINIVAGEVPGAVNGVFKDAPLKEILDSILISNGYGYRAVGESLVVSDLENLGQVNPFFESATIPVGAANVDEVVAGAQLLSTPQGQVRAIPSAASVFVLDFPDRVAMIREFVASVDKAARQTAGGGRGAAIGVGPEDLQVTYMKTHFVDADAAVTLLQTVLSPVGRVAAMTEEDRLLVVDYAENVQMAATVLRRIDRPRPQVSVQALIYDISLQDMEQIGLNWQSINGGNSTTSLSGGALATTPITGGTGAIGNSLQLVSPSSDDAGATFNFFTLNSNLNLSAVAVALQQASDSRLLASPNVTVIDNDEAIIESVEEIPFQQLTQTSDGGNIGTTAFRDAGVTLRVRPKISFDSTIELRVQPEFSRLTGFTPGDNQPIIDRRTATTRVRVANGQTFVIAGLRQRSDVGDFSGVPLLKDVRFFGHLFRGRDTEIRESELVVFISPTIVGAEDPLDARSHCISETVRGRLEQIPCPEGRPYGGHCQGGCPGGCQNGCQTGEAVEVLTSPGVAAPEPAATPEPSDILPLPPTTEEAAARSTPTLSYPKLSELPRPRRLPPVEFRTPVDEPTADESPEPPRDLRPNYDKRYRASGGVYSARRPAAASSPPAPDDTEASEKSLWRRVLFR